MNRVAGNKFSGMRISIFGMSHTGVSAAKLLRQNGAEVFISESRELDDNDNVCELRRMGVTIEMGGNSHKLLDADLIIKSPGISTTNPLLEKARAQSIPIIGEIDLIFSYFKPDSQFICVTGSNGKTTTCSLICHILESAGKDAVLVGHRNTPLSQIVLEERDPSYIVQEVSYADLRDNTHIKPDIAALLNIYPDHLDQAKDLHEYASAKFSLFDNMIDSSRKIISAQCYRDWSEIFKEHGRVKVFDNADIRHAYCDMPSYFEGCSENVFAAVEIVKMLGVSKRDIEAGLLTNSPPEHRREVLNAKSKKGVTFINDAKGTNVASLKHALNREVGSVVLIAGGRDKKADYSVLDKVFKKKVKMVIAIGPTAARLVEFCCKWGVTCLDYSHGKLVNAAEKAYEISSEGDVVLYSPGASSAEPNCYRAEDCGILFKEAVMRLIVLENGCSV